MEYKTLYNIGDSVWFMYQDKAVNGVIECIKVCNYKSEQDNWKEVYKEKYFVKTISGATWLSDDLIFTTKESLLLSL